MNDLESFGNFESFDRILEFNKNYKNPTKSASDDYVLFFNDIYLGHLVPGEFTINIDSKSCEGVLVGDFRTGARQLNGSMFFAIVKFPISNFSLIIKLSYNKAISGTDPIDESARSILLNAGLNWMDEDSNAKNRKKLYREVDKIFTNPCVNLEVLSTGPVFRKMIFSEYKKIEDVKNTAVSARETLGQAKDFAAQALNRGFRMFGKETSKETSKGTGGRKRRTRRKRSTKSKRRRG